MHHVPVELPPVYCQFEVDDAVGLSPSVPGCKPPENHVASLWFRSHTERGLGRWKVLSTDHCDT